VTPRTLLALSAAVLAFSAGALAVDGSVGTVSDTAAAAEVTHDSARVHVSNAKLRRVDSIELDAESLVLRNGRKTVVESSMRESGFTVGLLDRLLGTTYTWGGAIRVAALSTDARAGNAVEIRVLRDQVRSRTGKQIELTGPHGVQVGDDIADEIADASRAERVSFGSADSGAWQLLLEAGWATDDSAGSPGDDTAVDSVQSGTNGVSALTNETTVTVLGSPMPVHAERTC